MQDSLNHFLWMVYGTSGLLVAFCAAFVWVIMHSHKQKLQLQAGQILEIRRSELKYRTLFQHSPAGMIKFNYDLFEFIDANEALREMFVCTTIDELQQYMRRLLPDHHAFIQAELGTAGIIKDYEFSFVDNEGQARWMLFSARAEPDEKIAYGVFRDITRRKSGEDKIKEQAALLNQTRDGVISVSMDCEIVFWNEGAAAMYG